MAMASAARQMSDQARAKTVMGSAHSMPVISLLGNIAWGKSARMVMAMADPTAATSNASATTQTWGLSVFASCCASPRFNPRVASCAANSTIRTA
jgi:hypothetical protein